MDLSKLEKLLHKYKQPQFRLEQIRKAVFQDGAASISEITTLSKELREKLEDFKILSCAVEKILEAKDGQSVKALFKLPDGKFIESVLISPKPNTWSVCVSTQVGCPMNCRFCATGKLGLQRNLTAEEITDQVLFWKQYLRNAGSGPTATAKDTNGGRTATASRNIADSKFQTSPTGGQVQNSKFTIVLMGMGEPFLNWENVKASLKNLINPELFGFGARSISVSTSGIPEGIEKLAQEFPQINLAISLHFADDQKRNEFMPVNRQYNLEVLSNSLRKYLRNTNRKVFIEYILLDKINDGREDADKLSKYLKSIGKLQLLHVNLIRYNSAEKGADPSVGIGSLRPSPKETARKFKNYLLQNHIQVTIRKSLGEEIQGACGQLSGKK